jgi:hypothetical protein
MALGTEIVQLPKLFEEGTLQFSKWDEGILNAAVNLGDTTIVGGLLYLIITDVVQWRSLTGAADTVAFPTEPDSPAPLPNEANGVLCARFQASFKIHDAHMKARQRLRSLLMNSIPTETAKRASPTQRLLNLIPMSTIYQYIQTEHGIMTAQEYQAATNVVLEKRMSPDETIQDVVNRHEGAFRIRLEQTGALYDEVEKVRYLRQALPAKYNDIITHWERSHPTIASQSSTSLIKSLYEEERRTDGTLRSHQLANSVTDHDMEEKLNTRINAMILAAFQQHQPSRKQQDARGTLQYCFKHGFNYSHSSDGTGLHRCRLADADGFRKDANEKNYKNIKGASRKNEDLKK